MSTPTLDGPTLRAWRLAHGWTQATVAVALGYRGRGAMAQWETGRNPVPARLVAYMAQHPPPPAVDGYPVTPEGLHAAITAQGGTLVAWCRGWGTSYMTLRRWLQGTSPLRLDIVAWLRAGAPAGGLRLGTSVPKPVGREPPPRVRLPAKPLPARGDPAVFQATRERLGLTRYQAAARLGVVYLTICHWEHGETPPPADAGTRLATHGAAEYDDWIYVRRVGWVPPAGYCAPERDALQLPGCGRCGWRSQCVELHGEKARTA